MTLVLCLIPACRQTRELGAFPGGGGEQDAALPAEGGARPVGLEAGTRAGGGAGGDGGGAADLAGPADAARGIPDAAADSAPAPDLASIEAGPPPREGLLANVRHLVVDRPRRRIYATLGGSPAKDENLAIIDVTAPRILRTMAVGAGASALTLSEDGTRLWVALDGAIRRLDLSADAAGIILGPLRPSLIEGRVPVQVVYLAAAPGAPNTVMGIIRDAGFGEYSVQVLDDGQPRYKLAPIYAGATGLVAGVDGWFFATYQRGLGAGQQPAGGVQAFRMDNQGVEPAMGLYPMRFSSTLSYAEGRLFLSSGEIVNVAASATPSFAGDLGFDGLVLGAPTRGRALMVSGGFYSRDVTVRLFDLPGGALRAAFAVQDIPGTELWDLSSIDDDSCAFVQGDAAAGMGSLHILRELTSRLAASPAGPDAGAPAEIPLPEPVTEGVTRLRLPARHLIADHKRQLLHVSVLAFDPPYADAVLTVDPDGPSVRHITPVGPLPDVLALADDGSKLWVGVDGAVGLRDVDLTTTPPSPGPLRELPRGRAPGITPRGIEGNYAASIVPVPGRPESVVVALHSSESTGVNGAYVLDNHVPRPMAPDYDVRISMVVRGEGNWLFGFDNLRSDYGLRPLRLLPDGLEALPLAPPFFRSGTEELRFWDGRLYASAGPVLDARDPAALAQVGRFGFQGTIAVDPSIRRALVITTPDRLGGPFTARLLDIDRFSQVASIDLPLPHVDRVFDLVSLDGDRVAFIGAMPRAPIGAALFVARGLWGRLRGR